MTNPKPETKVFTMIIAATPAMLFHAANNGHLEIPFPQIPPGAHPVVLLVYGKDDTEVLAKLAEMGASPNEEQLVHISKTLQ